MSEVPLTGGDMNVVVRVGDTARPASGPPGVRALLERKGIAANARWLKSHSAELATFLA